MKKLNQLAIAVGLLAALNSASSTAAVISVSGETVSFSFDDSFLSSLFGSYSVTGDTLSFSPTEFVANQIGYGSVTTRATTPLISVTSKSGYALTQLNLFEQGDYYRLHESDTSKSYAKVGGQFIVNNNPYAITPSSPLTSVLSYDDPFVTTSWSASKSVDLNQASSATVKVENILKATVLAHDSLDEAFIEKKQLDISASTIPSTPNPVPLPASVWMFGTAVMGFLYTRRHTKA